MGLSPFIVTLLSICTDNTDKVTESPDTITKNYVVQSRFFVLVSFLLSIGLVLFSLIYFWYAVGLELILGVDSPTGEGLASYILSLIYLLSAMIVSIIVGLLSVVYFEKVVAYLYSVALDRNAREYKLKKKWFRGITLTCVAAVLQRQRRSPRVVA